MYSKIKSCLGSENKSFNAGETLEAFSTSMFQRQAPWPPQRSLSTASQPTTFDVRRASVQPDPDIYEPIYDSRWRLLNQVRLQQPLETILTSSKSFKLSNLAIMCRLEAFVLASYSIYFPVLLRSPTDSGLVLCHFLSNAASY